MGAPYPDKQTLEQHLSVHVVSGSKGRASPTPHGGGISSKAPRGALATALSAARRLRHRHPWLLLLSIASLLALLADALFFGRLLPIALRAPAAFARAPSCLSIAQSLEPPRALLESWRRHSRALPAPAPPLVPSDWRGPVNRTQLAATRAEVVAGCGYHVFRYRVLRRRVWVDEDHFADKLLFRYREVSISLLDSVGMGSSWWAACEQ